MRIGIGGDGTVFTNRMQGWYKASLKSVYGGMQGGCYNDSHPSPVTSVRLFLAPDAPEPEVDAVLRVLKRGGWGRNKINIELWHSYPNPPK